MNKSVWLALVAGVALAGCGSIGLDDGPVTVYSGKVHSYRGIETQVDVVRESRKATVCSIDAEFINDTAEDSRFMTLAVRAFSSSGKLLHMELVRSSNVRPGGHNRVRMQDTGLCALPASDVDRYTLELF